jgi:hypothetical protein
MKELRARKIPSQSDGTYVMKGEFLRKPQYYIVWVYYSIICVYFLIATKTGESMSL